MNESKMKEIKKDMEQTKKRDFSDELLEFISPYHVSTNPYELESASADLTSLPSYHYKFKKKYLANYIVRPANTEELQKVIRKCRTLEIPITIRSAGTSCFSSATPTKGGLIVDVRRLNKIFEIDAERKTVKCGSGISWLNLNEALADYGLAPKCYPTSFKTSCVGGFIGTPGTAGIGVVKYGSMMNSIISLDLVKPDGSLEKITQDSTGDISLSDICGTYGIYGVVATVELSVTTLKTSLEIIGYGFNSINDAVDFYSTLKKEMPNKPFFLSISEGNFEKYSHVDYPKNEWLVWGVFYDDPEHTSKSISTVKSLALKMEGVEVEVSYLKEKWRDISDAEVGIGVSTRNLIFQEYWVADKRLNNFIELYSNRKKKFKFLTASYAISGEEGWTRVKIFGLTDINKPREFFAVKAFLHELVVYAFNQGDRIYTVGVVNTFYLHKFKPEEVQRIKFLKDRLDPKELFNSYRITNSRMKFRRVSLLFKTAKLLYKI